MRFIPLEKLINLHDGYRREFTVDYHRLLLLQHDGEHQRIPRQERQLQHDGEHCLVEARCPHLEHPLIEAWIEHGKLQCPLHGYQFSLHSGRLLKASGGEDCRPLRVWPVAYEGSAVGVVWDSGAG